MLSKTSTSNFTCSLRHLCFLPAVDMSLFVYFCKIVPELQVIFLSLECFYLVEIYYLGIHKSRVCVIQAFTNLDTTHAQIQTLCYLDIILSRRSENQALCFLGIILSRHCVILTLYYLGVHKSRHCVIQALYYLGVHKSRHCVIQALYNVGIMFSRHL